ncbi:M81 family metallopeptidase [Brucellaceae bacterium C25G]
MRIAVGGIHTECSTYNPVLAQEKDFDVLRGVALLDAPRFAFLQDYNAEFVPTLHARAIPGGPVSRAVYEDYKADFSERLKAALPIDGLYLAMHGAMFVEGMEDAEGDWISNARMIVGDDCPISASYDLHGNVSQRIIDALNMFSTYRTAPHIDVEETMRRSVTMLVKSLEEGITPSLVWAPVPVMMPGERTSTEDEPAKSLYARLPHLDTIDGIWDASLMVGYVWADEPRATAAAIFTGTDRAVLEHEAIKLAQAYWDAREDFIFGCETGSISECVSRAIASKTSPVILAESGDNPTGGGVGDRADVLEELIRQKAEGVIFAGITDAPALEKCFAAGEGRVLSLSIGATLDTSGSQPVTAQGTVIRLYNADRLSDRQAIFRIAGIDLVICAKRRPYHNIADFTLLGLDPNKAKIVIVKSGYLSPELAPIANPNLMALSKGVVDQFVERLPRLRKAHPTFPFDREFVYEAAAIGSVRNPADT